MRAGPIRKTDPWPGSEVVIIGPPEGTDSFCKPAEAIADNDSPFVTGKRFCMRIELEPGDLEALQRDGCFWLVLHGAAIQPFGFSLDSDR